MGTRRSALSLKLGGVVADLDAPFSFKFPLPLLPGSYLIGIPIGDPGGFRVLSLSFPILFPSAMEAAAFLLTPPTPEGRDPPSLR